MADHDQENHHDPYGSPLMAWELSREVIAFLSRDGSDLTAAERVALLAIAEHAAASGRYARLAWDGPDWSLSRIIGMTEVGTRRTLQRLASRGLEVRVSRGVDARGRPMFAHRGAQVTYRLPELCDDLSTCPEKGGTGVPPSGTGVPPSGTGVPPSGTGVPPSPSSPSSPSSPPTTKPRSDSSASADLHHGEGREILGEIMARWPHLRPSRSAAARLERAIAATIRTGVTRSAVIRAVGNHDLSGARSPAAVLAAVVASLETIPDEPARRRWCGRCEPNSRLNPDESGYLRLVCPDCGDST